MTENGAESEDASALTLREWDPIPNARDREQPHMLDGT